MRGRVGFAGVVVALACAVLATGAGAATTIGMTAFPTLDTDPDPLVNPYNCLRDVAPMADTATLIQFQRQAGSTPSYTVPAGGGVVTSWNHMAPDPIGFAETAALQMLRPAGGTQFTVIGQSAVEPIINGPNSFPTRVPVQAGDVLGLYVQHGGNVAYCQEAAPNPPFNDGDKTREIDFTQNPAVGTVLDFTGNEQSARLDVSAVIEPDRDGDGFGDETQDNCVGTPPACGTGGGGGGTGGGGDTEPPDTTLSGKKRVKTDGRSAKVKFTFGSDDPGATFMCRLDAKPLKPCASPKTVKARIGTHVFAVEAIDAAGNVDPTGSAKLFKVVRSK